MKTRILVILAAVLMICSCGSRDNVKLKFDRYEIPGLEETPDFWKVRPEQIIDLCSKVKVGRSEVIAHTPAGFPVYACFYGDFNEPAPATNWSAGNSSSAIGAYLGSEDHPQTVMLLAGVHGAEPEGTAAAMNMIQMLETGKDFRGITDTTLLDLASKYRLIIIPCANMDGRAICPDHLRGQPYEVFRAVCQGTWKDGSLVGWLNSKKHFPLPIDQVSFPGGYPNSEGYNIQHDVAPGDMKTEEAKAICRLLARWRVDAMLNAHSCESAPHMVYPSVIDTKRHVARGCEISDTINARMFRDSLRFKPYNGKSKETLNLSSIVNWCSGGFGLTLECSSSYDNIGNPTICYTFDQMMEPVFIALKAIMESGLDKPLAGRVQEQKNGIKDVKSAFMQMTLRNYSSSDQVTENFLKYSDLGLANDVQLLQLYLSVFLPDHEVERLLGLFDWENNCWKDIDYKQNQRGRWPCTFHVTRMYALAKLYVGSEGKWKGNEDLRKLLHGGMAWWYENMPVCRNWWHNQIGVPKKFAGILMMLRNELTPEELEGGLRVLEKAKFGMTGQNKVWLAGNNLMRGLLINDEALVKEAAEQIKATICVTDEEGIQRDWSFHQHGAQLQLGNYGLAYAECVSFWMSILKGSKYDFTPQQKKIIGNLVKNGISRAVYNGTMDPSFCGRQNFINAGRGKAHALAVIAQNLSVAFDGEADFYTRLSDEILQPEKFANSRTGQNYYWRSDCGIYRQQDWYASIKMHSNRVVGFEMTNRENSYGNFSADGALLLMQDGNEFIDIFAYWDWRKIPGTTTYDDGKPMKSSDKIEDKRNYSDHVGGLAYDGVMAATMELNRDSLRALKAAFFFDGCIVNLGAGISGPKDVLGSVTTGIEQIHLSGSFRNGDLWAWHADRGYLSLDGSPMNVTGGIQKGKWDYVEPSFKDAWDEGEVFKCWFEHPMDKVDAGEAGYAYAIFPRTGLRETKALAKEWSRRGTAKGLKVLCNDVGCQAVSCGGALAAVFHQPGTYVLDGDTYEVTEPQVVIRTSAGEDKVVVPVISEI